MSLHYRIFSHVIVLLNNALTFLLVSAMFGLFALVEFQGPIIHACSNSLKLPQFWHLLTLWLSVHPGFPMHRLTSTPWLLALCHHRFVPHEAVHQEPPLNASRICWACLSRSLPCTATENFPWDTLISHGLDIWCCLQRGGNWH